MATGVTLAAVEFVILAFVTAFVLRHYASKTTPWVALITVFISWCVGGGGGVDAAPRNGGGDAGRHPCPAPASCFSVQFLWAFACGGARAALRTASGFVSPPPPPSPPRAIVLASQPLSPASAYRPRSTACL
jgi:hypothetical protein